MKKKQYVKIPLKNKEEKLIRYDGNALAELEGLLGRKVLALFHGIGTKGETEILESFGFGELRAFLYAGLQGSGTSGMTLQRVGSLMYTDTEHMREYLQAIMAAISVATQGKLPEELIEEMKDDDDETEDGEDVEDPTPSSHSEPGTGTG